MCRRFRAAGRRANHVRKFSTTFARLPKGGLKRSKTKRGTILRATQKSGLSTCNHIVMPKLPVVSGADAARSYQKDGWVFARRKSSHMVFTKSGVPVNLSIPDHRELKAGLLRG